MQKINKSIFLVLIILTYSCRKDFERPNWDVDLLAPLVKTTLTINDLLPDSVVQTNSDSSLKIVYQTDIFTLEIDSFLNIPDTTVSDFFSIPLAVLANPGVFFLADDKEIKLNVGNDIELNYILVKSGYIETTIFSEIQEAIIIEYTIPSARKNGDTLVLRETIPAGTPTQDGFFTKQVDLSGYEMDLTGISGSEINTIVTRIRSAIDTNAAGPIVVFAGEKITFTNKLIDVIPSYVRGYFGNQQINIGPTTTNFDVFQNINAGSVDIEQADVTLSIKNGIGADAQIILNQFETVNNNSNANNLLSGSIIGSSININRAQETFTVPEVNYSYKDIQINSSNSNIDQALEIFPNQLIYDIDLNINPFGNLSGHNDFLFTDHTLEGSLNIEFPLSFMANNLVLIDSSDFSLNNENTNGEIIDGDLILYAENGYPFDATIELQLLDGNGSFISSILSLDKIDAAPVDASLKVISKRSSRIVYNLSKIDVDNLYDAQKIVIKVAFSTIPQSQFIKIYEEYEMDLKVVGDFSYNINLK